MNMVAVVQIGIMAVVAFLVLRRFLRRPGATRSLPTGDAVADRDRIARWWQLECDRAGLHGPVDVVALPYSEAARQATPFWRSFAPGSIVFVESPLRAEQVFTARLPWSRPLVAHVFTSGDGTICRVVFDTTLTRAVPGEVIYRKTFVEIGRLVSHNRFEGPGAETLNADKEIVAAADAAVSLGYIPPRAIANRLVQKNGAVILRPSESGTTLLVDTLPRTKLVGGDISFGLELVIALCNKLDPA